MKNINYILLTILFSFFSFYYIIIATHNNKSFAYESKDIDYEKSKVLIEHLGYTDKPIYPFLFVIKDKTTKDSANSFSTIPESRRAGLRNGFILRINKEEMDTLKKIIKSYACKAIKIHDENPFLISTDFGTFSIAIFRNNVIVTDFFLNEESASKLFYEIYELLSNDNIKSTLFKEELLPFFKEEGNKQKVE